MYLGWGRTANALLGPVALVEKSRPDETLRLSLDDVSCASRRAHREALQQIRAVDPSSAVDSERVLLIWGAYLGRDTRTIASNIPSYLHTAQSNGIEISVWAYSPLSQRDQSGSARCLTENGISYGSVSSRIQDFVRAIHDFSPTAVLIQSQFFDHIDVDTCTAQKLLDSLRQTMGFRILIVHSDYHSVEGYGVNYGSFADVAFEYNGWSGLYLDEKISQIKSMGPLICDETFWSKKRFLQRSAFDISFVGIANSFEKMRLTQYTEIQAAKMGLSPYFYLHKHGQVRRCLSNSDYQRIKQNTFAVLNTSIRWQYSEDRRYRLPISIMPFGLSETFAQGSLLVQYLPESVADTGFCLDEYYTPSQDYVVVRNRKDLAVVLERLKNDRECLEEIAKSGSRIFWSNFASKIMWRYILQS